LLELIIWPAVALGGLGLLFGLGLAVAAKKFAVAADPNIEKVRALLPGANCGACGYPGCDGFAKALCQGGTEISKCNACSTENAEKIAALLGQEAPAGEKKVARILCRGDNSHGIRKYDYLGISDCRAAALIAGGPKVCPDGCIGLGTCVSVCPFGAIKINDRGIAEVDEEKCTGCGKCVEACPKNVIRLMDRDIRVYIACRSVEKGRKVTTACKAGCIGCGLCAKACPFGAITMVNNLPVIDYDKCRQCGICAEKCPRGTIRFDKEKRPKAEIDKDICIACGQCKKACPVDAIEGVLNQVHEVDKDKCTGCGVCVETCPTEAIQLKK